MMISLTPFNWQESFKATGTVVTTLVCANSRQKSLLWNLFSFASSVGKEKPPGHRKQMREFTGSINDLCGHGRSWEL